MRASNNPTALSVVVGDGIVLSGGPRAVTTLVKDLLMPTLLAGFATYLVVGIVTMEVPEGTAFPGPQFFPGIIAAGLYLFAILLGGEAVRDWRRSDPRRAGAGPEAEAATDVAPAPSTRLDWASLAWVVGSFLVFALLLDVLGWILAAALLFVGVTRGFASPRWLFNAIVGLTLSSLTYVVFDMMLGMALPSGLLGWRF
ncbi:tripartite tricarboxylate transporter TctB family protein [Microbacterium sp. JZ31]|uniref:tripartite tricarboxylate transporter TctB family protein n=1 Tax=Microbacterium sp. JZ31 TaxID=1906274 RepID=UPI001933B448|nr:tripartite tricarboxylate transporter TctB family protein [Microbacterium sp. JZ31]